MFSNYGWEIATTYVDLQTLSVTPASNTVFPNQSITLTTNEVNADSRRWCLSLSPSGCPVGADIGTQGTLRDLGGYYAQFTAPPTITESYGGEYACVQDVNNQQNYACANLNLTPLTVNIVGGPYALLPGQMVAIQASTSGSSQGVSWSWSLDPSFGSGSAAPAQGSTGSVFTYTAPGSTGSTTLTAKATVNGGASATASTQITVLPTNTTSAVTASPSTVVGNYNNGFSLSAHLSSAPSLNFTGYDIQWMYSGATNLVGCLAGQGGTYQGQNACYMRSGTPVAATFSASACITISGQKQPICGPPTNITITPEINGITDGETYSVTSNVNSSLCLDNTDWSLASGTNAQLWSCNGLAVQNWTFHQQGLNRYTIQNEYTGLCLTNGGNSTVPGNKLTLVTCNASDGGQLWGVTNLQNGTYNIIAGSSPNLFLDDPSGSLAPGVQPQIWTSNGLPPQQWRLFGQPAYQFLGDGDIYKINNEAATGLCLDNTGFSSVNNTSAQLWTCNGLSAQQWVM